MENTIVYHYTSFDKFEQIMKNGTLRFKESTASNDYQDTTLIVDVLTKMELVSAVDSKEKAALEFILNLYKKTDIAKRYIHLVSCYSKVPDSRMLWDAYSDVGQMWCTHCGPLGGIGWGDEEEIATAMPESRCRFK